MNRTYNLYLHFSIGIVTVMFVVIKTKFIFCEQFYAVPTLTKLLNIQQSHFKLLLFDINHLKGNKKKKKSSSSVLENHVRVKNAKGD